MTFSYPRQAFDKASPMRRAAVPLPEGDRLVSIAITIAVHVLIVAAALATVKVVQPKVVQELTVRISPERPKPLEELKLMPKVAAPVAVTVPLPVPEVTIQTIPAPPVMAQPPQATPVVQTAPTATPKVAAGESRDLFLGKVLAELNRVKQYPRLARQAHIEGVVMLHFVMDAQGKLVSSEIAKSSGRPVLDNEALALIQRAQLPPLPPAFPTKTLDAVVPIEFSIAG